MNNKIESGGEVINVGNFADAGDSITSDEVTGIGTEICKQLGATMIGNFAHGNAHCANWQL